MGYRTPRPDEPVVIDCDECAVRGPGCRECVVSVLLGVPETLLEDERAALPFVPRAHDAAVSVPRFDTAYGRMFARSKKGALQRALWAVHWRAAVLQMAWVLGASGVRVAQAVALGAYLEWLTAAEAVRAGGEAWRGWALACGICSASLVFMMMHHQMFWCGLGWREKAGTRWCGVPNPTTLARPSFPLRPAPSFYSQDRLVQRPGRPPGRHDGHQLQAAPAEFGRRGAAGRGQGSQHGVV